MKLVIIGILIFATLAIGLRVMADAQKVRVEVETRYERVLGDLDN